MSVKLRFFHIFFWMFWFFSIVVADQFTKGQAREVTFNPGISFGWFAWLSGQGSWVFLLSVAGSFFLLSAYLSRQIQIGEERRVSLWNLLWLHAVGNGAVWSNLLDRWRFGGVRDVWYIPMLGLQNNLADWGIAAVTLVWMWYLYRYERTKSTKS